MKAAAAILALALAGCGSVQQVDVVTRAETWGRHHGRATVGPRVTYANGVEVYAWAGRQDAIYAPGEPHYSERAPSAEWQGGVEVSVPVWRRR